MGFAWSLLALIFQINFYFLALKVVLTVMPDSCLRVEALDYPRCSIVVHLIGVNAEPQLLPSSYYPATTINKQVTNGGGKTYNVIECPDDGTSHDDRDIGAGPKLP